MADSTVEMTTDEVDRRILRALQDDGRISIVDLADRVGLSPTPCNRRVRKLEEAGLISGYSARIDHKAAGFGITAFVSVELERQQGEEITRFQSRVAQFEEVVTGALMTGSQDFLLEVVVGSLEEYELFLQSRLMKVPGVRAVRSRFALRKFISRSRIP
ncbi:Lrp/AsnC family transcriptional regulator, leucine-responsive regulatory protein [Lutimaribacter pacificus]|uniref:Transcriptional regulator, AsnC family n=2 Tax=Lutimaribacter pacificus TaxID=391948 RepID=A0A1H0NQZ7_9RHOB|nr:Lrp/AsnC family transcriptional regulator, leucine-responsive regulatory protein [Lutimaribacter pacificus]SHK96432.1 transcriptional regulator, AsnC family [Lutimaribacter pacificus]